MKKNEIKQKFKNFLRERNLLIPFIVNLHLWSDTIDGNKYSSLNSFLNKNHEITYITGAFIWTYDNFNIWHELDKEWIKECSLNEVRDKSNDF